MASFFQPAVYDPNAVPSENSSSSLSSQSRFLIYVDSTLIGAGILANWYQYVVLGISAAALLAPLFRWLMGWIWSWYLRKKGRQDCFPRVKIPDPTRPNEGTLASNSWDSYHSNVKASQPIHSFGLFLRGTLDNFLSINYDLHIIDLETCSRGVTSKWLMGKWRRSSEIEGLMSKDSEKSRQVWGLVGEAEWDTVSSKHITLLQTIDSFRATSLSCGLSGLVISSSIGVRSRVNEVILLLVRSGLPCILLDDASNPNYKVDPSILSGIIYRNACILSNGSRRDYFQASKLRRSLARHCEELKRDPNYLIAFLDLWVTRPLPSVIRRAFKFANFHRAIFHHSPAREVYHEAHTLVSGNPSSAFDWLKRDEIIKVCFILIIDSLDANADNRRRKHGAVLQSHQPYLKQHGQ